MYQINVLYSINVRSVLCVSYVSLKLWGRARLGEKVRLEEIFWTRGLNTEGQNTNCVCGHFNPVVGLSSLCTRKVPWSHFRESTGWLDRTGKFYWWHILSLNCVRELINAWLVGAQQRLADCTCENGSFSSLLTYYQLEINSKVWFQNIWILKIFL